MITRNLLFLTFLFCSTACDEQALDNTEQIEFRDAAVTWDSITCLLGTTRCYGHRPNAQELWSPLLSECDLQAKIADEGWWETADGFTQLCDYGGFPSTFPEYRCFHPGIAGEVDCFGGGDGWYTKVLPSCDLSGHTETEWPAWYCEVDFGDHEYDQVLASPHSPTSAIAVDGGDRFAVVDDCKLAGGGNPPPSPFCK